MEVITYLLGVKSHYTEIMGGAVRHGEDWGICRRRCEPDSSGPRAPRVLMLDSPVIHRSPDPARSSGLPLGRVVTVQRLSRSPRCSAHPSPSSLPSRRTRPYPHHSMRTRTYTHVS